MKIIIETIPHKDQAYNTVGDWRFDADGTLQVRVSEFGDWKHQACIGIHEAIEALLCTDKGISQENVDAFDKNYKGDEEPGDQPDAPYHVQHCIATTVERLLVASFGLNWKEYEAEMDKLPEWKA